MSNYYQLNPEEINDNLDPHIDFFIESLVSEFLVLPKGSSFVEFSEFDDAYESLKRATGGFKALEEDKIFSTICKTPLSLLVLRSILGLTMPEWAHLTADHTGVGVGQGYARGIEKSAKNCRVGSFKMTELLEKRLRALLKTAILLIEQGAPVMDSSSLHRMNKPDTKEGMVSLRSMSQLHSPYSVLLYERYLGRPFASHRDAVSELVGDVMENAVATLLDRSGITYHATGRAERIPGFDQAPDFLIPNMHAPKIIIEAKITEDDGTARDKVTRIQHLKHMSDEHVNRYEVIACVDGRGFGIRRDDVRKMLQATGGKVFTRSTLEDMVEWSKLSEYVTAT